MMVLGSGDPTRSICSAVIAQAFQSVRYPILPMIARSQREAGQREILAPRPTSFYTPADFDISPYFAVIKPMIEAGFDYGQIRWADAPVRVQAARPRMRRARVRSGGPIAGWAGNRKETGKTRAHGPPGTVVAFERSAAGCEVVPALTAPSMQKQA